MNGWINVKDRLPEDKEPVEVRRSTIMTGHFNLNPLQGGDWEFDEQGRELQKVWEWRPKGQSETVAESVDGSAAAELLEMAAGLDFISGLTSTNNAETTLKGYAQRLRKLGGKS